MTRRTNSRRRRQPSDEASGLAGWMYTDLLLGLAVVFLGSIGVVVATSQDDDPPVEVAADGEVDDTELSGRTATTSSTSSTTTTTSTTVPLETCQVLYDPAEDADRALKVTIKGAPNPEIITPAFREQISERLSEENALRTDGGEDFNFNTMNVALVIINHGPSAGDGVDSGGADTKAARQVFLDLKERFPRQFADAVVRPGKISTGERRTSIEIFLIYERPCRSNV